jgi:hypothetical protein
MSHDFIRSTFDPNFVFVKVINTKFQNIFLTTLFTPVDLKNLCRLFFSIKILTRLPFFRTTGELQPNVVKHTPIIIRSYKEKWIRDKTTMSIRRH